MASATLTHELNPPGAIERRAAPMWWRRGHSYAFIAVTISEIGLSWGLVRLMESALSGVPGMEEVISAAIIGFLFAQCFLLGLWAALGGLATVIRWLIVGAVATLGALAVTFEFISPQWQDFFYHGPILAVLAMLMIAGIAVVLLPLRRLAGWRVDFDAAYHPSTGRRRGQMELMDFAAMFCAVALPLALGRALVELMGKNDAAGIGVVVPILSSLVLATAGPVAYTVLARRGLWISLAACTAWVVIVCATQSILVANFPALDVFGSRSGALLNWTVVAFHLGAAATVALPLLILRLFGLKLITVN